MLRPIMALSALLLPAAAAGAASYSAKLAQPTTQRFIARDIVWHCGPAACQGATAASRPLVLCQSLAKRAGHVAHFTVDGRALAADELDRCNSAARSTAPEALAAQ